MHMLTTQQSQAPCLNKSTPNVKIGDLTTEVNVMDQTQGQNVRA
jgi:hypothetical protein